jgi:hypothetical protein
MNFAYLVTFALVPLLSVLVVHSYTRRVITTSGISWKYLALVLLESCIIGIACSTVCQYALHDRVYVPTELTAIKDGGSVSYSSYDVSNTTVTLDKDGKYNVKLEMKDGKTVSLHLTDSEYNTLKKSFLESSGTGWMPKNIYVVLSILVGVVFCIIYLIVIYGRVIKQESTLYSAFKSSKHISMLYLFLIVVAICIHSYLLSYVVV